MVSGPTICTVMAWVGRKLDTLFGALLAAVGGMACSQFQAFAQQYLQRLGGHLDEARRVKEGLWEGASPATLEPGAWEAVQAAAAARITEIEKAYQAIRDAGPAAKPFEFLRYLDPTTARQVATDFQPTLPLDLASLAYTGAGLVLGLVIYELLKLPFALIFGRTRKRPFHA